jgi:SnoaL-like domain
MSAQHESPAVAIARAHVEAWSNHDFDAARRALGPDVQVTSTTTQPIVKDVRTTGIDDYMSGLIAFAQGVVPGSARVLASTGDERNALLLVTVEADLGGGKMELPGARLYLLDGDGKIQNEQVIFYAAAN